MHPSHPFGANTLMPLLQDARPMRARTVGWARGMALMLSLAAAQTFAQSAPASATPATSATPGAASGTAAVGASGGPVFDLLVGTYTGGGKSEGIYVYRFDTGNGELSRIASAQTVNPSYLVVSRDRNYVYAVNELPGDNGPATQRGGVSAFRFDRATGQLSFLNRVSSDGNDPCYLAISPDGKYLLTANYSVASNPGGSFAVFPLAANGQVGTSVLTVHHEGGDRSKGGRTIRTSTRPSSRPTASIFSHRISASTRCSRIATRPIRRSRSAGCSVRPKRVTHPSRRAPARAI